MNATLFLEKQMTSLEDLKQKIESLDLRHHLIIGAILKNNAQVKLNENKSGTLVNLSLIPQDVIEEIRKYLSYIDDQEITLSKIEGETEEYKQMISMKDNKQIRCNYSNNNTEDITAAFPHLI